MEYRYDQILVMGAGAVGGFFGARIAEQTGRPVTLIARGEHLKAMRERGLEIRSGESHTVIDVEAMEDPARAAMPDLVLFTVKSFDTPAAIEQLKPIVGEHTQILTIQNGIENYDRLVRAFGEERVIPGYCQIGAGTTKPGVIEHTALGRIIAGEPDGRSSDRLQALKELFEEAGIRFRASGEIWHDIWVKFAWNSIFNIVTALAEVTVDRLFEDEATVTLCRNLFGEIRAVAEKEGVMLDEEDERGVIDESRELEGFVTSTHRDRMKGKKLEYEAFTGAIIRRADCHGIEVPHNRTLYALLKQIG